MREPGSLPTAVTEHRGTDLKGATAGLAKTTRHAYGYQRPDSTRAANDAVMAARVDKVRTRGGGAW